MKPLRIAVVVGSIRQDSYSRRFAQALARLAPDDVKFDFIRIDDLPHYNQDHDGHDAPATPEQRPHQQHRRRRRGQPRARRPRHRRRRG